MLGGLLAACGGGSNGGGSSANAGASQDLGGRQTAEAAKQWKLVWSDEFDGSKVDTSKWSYDVGGDGWGNNELQYYTKGANAHVANSVLTIEARKEAKGGCAYTSCRMLTQGKAYWKFGKIEARIKLPYGNGTWPAFWLLGENIDTVDYPECGEIDIMEMVGGAGGENDPGDDSVIFGSAHRPYRGGAHGPDDAAPDVKSITAEYDNPNGIPFAQDFHVFGIEWNASSIRYYVDGHTYQTFNIAKTGDGYEVFQRPFFIILNLAIGGDWPGAPDSTTVFPQRMLVDWVRVYQLK